MTAQKETTKAVESCINGCDDGSSNAINYTTGADPAAFGRVTAQELKDFRQACTDTSEENGWSLLAQKKTCDVWMAPSSSSDVVCIRIDGTPTFEDVPPEVIWEIVTNSKHYPKWDGHMINFDVLQHLDPTSDNKSVDEDGEEEKENNEEDDGEFVINSKSTQLQLTYYSVKTPMPLANRDWTLRRIIHEGANEERMVISRSVELEAVPAMSGFVRARTILTGFRICPTPDGRGSSVVYYTHNEFGGSVPTRLVNWAAKSLASSIIDKLYQACQELMKEKLMTCEG